MTAIILATLIYSAIASHTFADDPRQDKIHLRERTAMIETIRDYGRTATDMVGANGISQKVLSAMAETERHRFVPKRYQ